MDAVRRETLKQVREALAEAERYGYVSPEWMWIRFLVTELDRAISTDGYQSGYRAGWNDALSDIVRHAQSIKKP